MSDRSDRHHAIIRLTIYLLLIYWKRTADSDELRSLRTGDWQRMKLGSLTTELGEDSIIVQSENELTLHVVSTKIRFRCTIPLHERCPELSQFFTDVWLPIMKEYQQTETPYILCTILNNPEKRKQLSADAVEKLNTRALKAAGIEATTNFSRHCDAKRTRTGPNRPEESAHGAMQDVQYQNCSSVVEPDYDAGTVARRLHSIEVQHLLHFYPTWLVPYVSSCSPNRC
eukprot:SAG25_NODE_477_length_7537_cov_143.345657_2_plen_228_part_00